MSQETAEWLNEMVLIGYADKRGNAWHYRADLQTPWEYLTEDDRHVIGVGNHYDGAIPVEHVQYRLFNWEPEERPVLVPIYSDLADGIEESVSYFEIPGKKAIVPSDDPSHVFGIFSDGYQPHGFDEWLVGNVSGILGDTLNISSAGLLRGRAVAWVEISVPETFMNDHTGVAFRPNLLATTSLDGTVATTYKRTVTLTVCDNTWGMAMAEKGQTYKRKHTRYSAGKIAQDEAREALNLIVQTADEVDAEIQKLTQIEVTRKQFISIVEGLIPITDDMSKTGTTLAKRKREQVMALHANDTRVAPWNETAFGAIQAFNTWNHHMRPTRGETARAERNMLETIKGDLQKGDQEVWQAIVKELQLTDV